MQLQRLCIYLFDSFPETLVNPVKRKRTIRQRLTIISPETAIQGREKKKVIVFLNQYNLKNHDDSLTQDT